MSEKKGVEYFLRKIASYHKIDELAIILKESLRDTFGMKYEYTFEEIESITKRKRLSKEMKLKLIEVCDRFTHLEYRKSNPSKKEISIIKKLMREWVKITVPPKAPEKVSALDEYVAKVGRSREKHKNIKRKVIREKEHIHKRISRQVKESLKHEEDKEINEIIKFIKTSLDLGIKKSLIRKELIEVGFESSKIASGFELI